MRNVNITNPGKLILLGLVILGCFVYIILGTFVAHADTTPAWAMLTLAVGYLIGNGAGAMKGVVTTAPFAPTPKKQIEVLKHAIEISEDDERHS